MLISQRPKLKAIFQRHVINHLARLFPLEKCWLLALDLKTISRVFLIESTVTMAKFSLAVTSSLVAGAAAFAPTSSVAKSSALQAKAEIWDPMGLYELGSGEAFDTFPNMFPEKQFLEAAEIKHGRQAMLAWTGVWATSSVRFFSF